MPSCYIYVTYTFLIPGHYDRGRPFQLLCLLSRFVLLGQDAHAKWPKSPTRVFISLRQLLSVQSKAKPSSGGFLYWWQRMSTACCNAFLCLEEYFGCSMKLIMD